MEILEEYLVALLLSLALTTLCALCGLAGWGIYRLISRTKQRLSRGRPVAFQALFFPQWIVHAPSMLGQVFEGHSPAGWPAALPFGAIVHSWSRRWKLPHFNFGHTLDDHTIARVELALRFFWAMVTMALLMLVFAWIFRGRS
jgi:hypothetical protein